MLRLILCSVLLAAALGVFFGLLRSFRAWKSGRTFTANDPGIAGFLVPMLPLWISGSLMMLPWGEADIDDEATFGFLWRATLVYLLSWSLVGWRVQAALEKRLMRLALQKRG